MIEGLYWSGRAKSHVRKLRRRQPARFSEGESAGRAALARIWAGEPDRPLPPDLIDMSLSAELDDGNWYLHPFGSEKWIKYGQALAEAAERDLIARLQVDRLRQGGDEGWVQNQLEGIEAFTWGYNEGWNSFIKENLVTWPQPVKKPVDRDQVRADPRPPAPPAVPISTTVPPSTPAEFKTCPDCAEQVRFAARKCRFCGFQFAED
jgi:hypothetical protein